MKRSYSIPLKDKSTKRSQSWSWQNFVSRRLRDCLASLFLLGGIYIFITLLSYNPSDPSWNTVAFQDHGVQNWGGIIGSHLSDILLQLCGAGSLLLPIFLCVISLRIWRDDDVRPFAIRILAMLAAIIMLAMSFSIIPSVFWLSQDFMGGIIGKGLMNFTAGSLTGLIGFSPAFIIAILAFVLSLFFFNIAIALKPDERELLMQHMMRGGALTAAGANSLWDRLRPKNVAKRSIVDKKKYYADDDEDHDDEYEEEDEDEEDTDFDRKEISVVKRETNSTKAKSKKSAQAKFDLREPSEWELPPVDFLQTPPKQSGEQLDESALRKNADLLQNVLSDYNVSGDITSIHPGPVVTLYELEPSPGTKTSRVVGLSDDIARSMSAISVRVAVVPGRNVIGIELPNKKRQTVYLRDLLEGPEFDDNNAKLPLVLGKDIGGQPIIADLARMPHLLVAGTTGSGKSVAVNTMILSLLYKLPPEKCRFIMIDPKMLELSVYDDIPHLLAPVVTEAGRAVVALKWTVQEMENRYRNMSKLGVRNIEGYNTRVKEARKKGEILMRKVQTGFDGETGKPVFEEQPLDLNEIPYIVVIVDEFADLMLVAGKDVENAIQRLAQMARAAGIHLIMATQRPSVDVITGVIKANFPTRISFQVTSKIDSRTILGEGGAETLLGMGDMLYMVSGGRLMRVHGPFVSDKEVEDVVNFLKAQGEPEYLDEVTDGDLFASADDEGGGGSSAGDELYDKAVALVAEEGKASTSFIQRHFQIGYNRAARIIDDMEKNGIVGKANHVGKREVLVGEHRRY